MGVGMINTVLFMAVIFGGVWNIVPHRLQQLRMKSRALTWGRVFVFVFSSILQCAFILFFFFPSSSFCPRSRRRKGCINNICAYRGKQTWTAPGCSWPLCVWGDHWNLPRELRTSLIVCTRLLWKHLRWKRSLSLSCHPSFFLLPPCLFPSPILPFGVYR